MDAGTDRLDANRLRRFRRAVISWYPRHARDLPWRRTNDPYRVWISEIMLQQTTVKAVVPYYERFLSRFPTVAALAKADEHEVLRHWEGLGYYSRARNLHKAARRIHDDRQGRFPESVDDLLELPGVGRYTAGAIASFAFDRPAPIVEANTLRLYCRLMGYGGDPRSSDGQKRLWEFAARIVPAKSPGRFNQALMELGATVCTPTNPACDRCPVRTCCRACADGTQDEIPTTARRPEVTHVTEAAVAVRKRGKWLLRKREEGERWAGLWDFPRFSWSGSLDADGQNDASRPQMTGTRKKTAGRTTELESRVTDQTGMTVELGELVTEIVHSVTRYRIRLLCFVADHRTGTVGRTGGLRWVSPAEFENYPLSVTGRKLATLLQSRHSEG